jgi:hypothetical protein
MPKQKDDKPIVLHPMTFEDALKRMLKTPSVNPAKAKKLPKRGKSKDAGKRDH